MAVAKRTHLGSRRSIIGRQRVYLLPEVIEVEEMEDDRTRLRRVFLDEVQLITHHRFTRWGSTITATVLGLLVGTLGMFLLQDNDPDVRTTGAVFTALGLTFVIGAVLGMIVRVDAVTVYGRRSMARVHFVFRKRRARETFAWLGRLAREAQAGRVTPTGFEPPLAQGDESP